MSRVRRRKAAVKRGSQVTEYDRRLWNRHADLLRKRFTTGLTPDEEAEHRAIGVESHQRWRERTGR